MFFRVEGNFGRLLNGGDEVELHALLLPSLGCLAEFFKFPDNVLDD